MTEMPGRVERLPRDHVGRPVPWFVATINGQPDFRVIRTAGTQIAVRSGLCWVCGIPFQRQEDRAFVIGPMCAVNRVSAEPPSHKDCAVYSAQACPFLARPNMTRRDRHIPDGATDPAGISIKRNPGVALVWITGYKSWSTRSDHAGGTLFDIGDCKEALWFARGRAATRREVLDSIDSGMPILADLAGQDGPEACGLLNIMHAAALELIPA